MRAGLNNVLPRPNFGGPGGMAGPDGAPARGGRAGMGGDGVQLDPLAAGNDASKPLISKLLAVPSLRARYLAYVRDVADSWLDWKKLGPIAQQYHDLIAADVKADTRKLDSTEAFLNSLAPAVGSTADAPANQPDRSIKGFADKRRAFLLK